MFQILKADYRVEEQKAAHNLLRDRKTQYPRDKSSIYAPWAIYDKPIGSFSSTYRVFLKERGLKSYVESELQDRQGQALGIELGGLGSKLFRGFSDGFFKRTLGVVLLDTRKGMEKEADEVRGHDVIEANVFEQTGFSDIESWLAKYGNGKADFADERMEGAISDFNVSNYFWLFQFRKCFRLLNDGGVLFAQWHSKNRQEAERGLLVLQKQLASSAKIGFDCNAPDLLLHLKKIKDSREN